MTNKNRAKRTVVEFARWLLCNRPSKPLNFKTLRFTDVFRRKLCLCRYLPLHLRLSPQLLAMQFQFILMSRLSSFQDSRARRSDGGERVELYIGETGGKNEGRFFISS